MNKTPESKLLHRKEYVRRNRDIINERQKIGYQKHRKERIERQRKYRLENKDIINQKQKEKYKTNQEERRKFQRDYYWRSAENRERHLLYNKEYRKNHMEQFNLSSKKGRYKAKLDVFKHYSGDPPKCACCGETKLEFLTIDHVNGGGRKHRLEVKGHFYEWVRKNNYPEGLRILCMNCNFALGCYGYCPHKGPVNGLS